MRFFRATTCSKFGCFTWRFSTNSHTFWRPLSAVYVNISAAWSWSVVSSEEMVAVSATTVSHAHSVPKPPVASLRRGFHVCKHTDWHLCTKMILTCDSLLYILAALNEEIGWCLFIVCQYHFDSSSSWQQTTWGWILFSKMVKWMKTRLFQDWWYLVYNQCCLDWSKEQRRISA